MSDANAKSSKTSKKEVENIIDIRALEIVGGPISIESDELVMNPEYAFDFTVEMADLVKSVGTYSKVVDENGKIVKRVDDKTGYVLVKDSLKKSINKAKGKTNAKDNITDVTIVSINDSAVRTAKKSLDGNKVKSGR